MNPQRMAGALAHFVYEALFAARDTDDALLRDLQTVALLNNGEAHVLEATVAGQRVEITVRAATPGLYAAGKPVEQHAPSCELNVPLGCRCSCGAQP